MERPSIPLLSGMLLAFAGALGAWPCAAPSPDAAPPVPCTATATTTADALTGLWRLDPGPNMAEDVVRFWYFHGDGKGLYRYGRVGLNQTHSFDYRDVDGGVEIRFRKSGIVHLVTSEIEARPDGRHRLRLNPDPEDPGAAYVRERGPVQPGQLDAPAAHGRDGGLGGRLWLDLQPYATGGAGFGLYQFNEAAIDGRGVGWYHQGDFDDWSTESLSYHVEGSEIVIDFVYREERARSSFAVEREGDDRVLLLHEDPRDFWKHHRYRDAGESFGTAFVGVSPAMHAMSRR